jgi:hypothetical protein
MRACNRAAAARQPRRECRCCAPAAQSAAGGNWPGTAVNSDLAAANADLRSPGCRFSAPLRCNYGARRWSEPAAIPYQEGNCALSPPRAPAVTIYRRSSVPVFQSAVRGATLAALLLLAPALRLPGSGFSLVSTHPPRMSPPAASPACFGGLTEKRPARRRCAATPAPQEAKGREGDGRRGASAQPE